MLSNFNKIFDDMVLDRLEDIGSNTIVLDDKYKELQEKLDVLFSQIKFYLPEEHRKLIYKLLEVSNFQMGVVEELIYKQGLKDGVELKKILEIAG